jgi:hypothetical protein
MPVALAVHSMHRGSSMSSFTCRLLSLGATSALLAACSLNPQPLPPGETADSGILGSGADATTGGDSGGQFAGPDGAGGGLDAASDTTATPVVPDGSSEGGDAATDGGADAPGDSTSEAMPDAPVDGPASEEGG